MTVEQFRKVHRARPFRPYELKLASGRSIRVKSPEFVVESESRRTLAVWSDDAFEIIDLLRVEGWKPATVGAIAAWADRH